MLAGRGGGAALRTPLLFERLAEAFNWYGARACWHRILRHVWLRFAVYRENIALHLLYYQRYIVRTADAGGRRGD
jgi:hypothetical protein